MMDRFELPKLHPFDNAQSTLNNKGVYLEREREGHKIFLSRE